MWTKRNRRRRPQRRIVLPRFAVNWPRVIGIVAAAVVTGAAYISTLWLMDQPIEEVVINGPFERVTAARLEERLGPHIRTGFLSADLAGIQAGLEVIPWVARASVRRRWPATIVVTIDEQEAAACWGDDGLLNVSGELFVRNSDHVPAELPRLRGPEGTEQQVAGMYFRIERGLEQRGLAAVALSLDGRGAWEFQLSNGIRVRLGSRLVDQRLDRFFVALDRVVASTTETVDYVDMRYTNGFAIGWKESGPVRNGEPNV